MYSILIFTPSNSLRSRSMDFYWLTIITRKQIVISHKEEEEEEEEEEDADWISGFKEILIFLN